MASLAFVECLIFCEKTGHPLFALRRVSGIAADEKLDVIPCNYFMELAELAVKADQDHAQHDRYKTALGEVAGEYDYCIIDNPPDLGMNVINAMVATQTWHPWPLWNV